MAKDLRIEGRGVRLRAIGAGDLEDLRRWKNANKAAFFFKGEISSADQRAWYEGYLERPEDFLFVVEAGGTKAGCLGARLKDGEVDVYNVIAAPEAKGKGLMAEAMRTLCVWAAEKWNGPISALVLEGNSAAGFYLKCGFTESEPGPNNSRKLSMRRSP